MTAIFNGRGASFLFATLLGGLSVAGFAPLGWYPLPILALAGLFALVGVATPGEAFRLGLAFGLGLFLSGVSWVYVSLSTYGGMPVPIAVVATVLFCAVIALFPALAMWAGARLTQGAARVTLALPAAWVLGEWLRGWIFTGFPWLAVGYSQAPASPLAGFAPLLGVYGVSLMAALIAGALATLIPSIATRSAFSRRGFMPDLFAIALLLAGLGLQQIDWTRPAGAPVSVALLQGNVPQEMKFNPEHLRTTLDAYARQVLASDARLIVLPETALPLFRSAVPRAYLDLLAVHARRAAGDVLVGLPEDEGRAHYFNSVISLGSSPEGLYRKQHLVPFGEFVPWGFRWAVDLMQIPLGDFSRGTPEQAPIAAAGERLAVNVCYEDAFGEERIAAARDATLLVNVSNDAWFGASLAPWQHLQIGAMRSLETGRWQLRANNTGITAVLDERGRVRAQLPPFTAGTLAAQAQGRNGLTPYTRWGNRPLLALAFGLLGLAIWLGHRYPATLRSQTSTPPA